jgi:hypothetical protein
VFSNERLQFGASDFILASPFPLPLISLLPGFPQFCPSFAYHGHAPDKFAGDGLRHAVSVTARSSVDLAFYVQNHRRGVPWLVKIAYDPASPYAWYHPQRRISVMRVQVFR